MLMEHQQEFFIVLKIVALVEHHTIKLSLYSDFLFMNEMIRLRQIKLIDRCHHSRQEFILHFLGTKKNGIHP